MRQTLLTAPRNHADYNDMEWLRDNHIPTMPLNYMWGSALVYGDEGAPVRVDVYDTRNPKITDRPKVYLQSPNGILREVRGILYLAYRAAGGAAGIGHKPVIWNLGKRFRYRISRRGYSCLDFHIYSEQTTQSIGARYYIKTASTKSKQWNDRRNARVALVVDLLNRHFQQ